MEGGVPFCSYLSLLMTLRDEVGREVGGRWEGGGRERTHDVYLWPIHVDVWQKHHNTVK